MYFRLVNPAYPYKCSILKMDPPFPGPEGMRKQKPLPCFLRERPKSRPQADGFIMVLDFVGPERAKNDPALQVLLQRPAIPTIQTGANFLIGNER